MRGGAPAAQEVLHQGCGGARPQRLGARPPRPRPGPPRLPPPPSPLRGCERGRRGRRARGGTVGVAGAGAVRGTGPRLGPSPAELQAVRVCKGRAAGEAEPLLLPCPALRHVHGQPRRPGGVAPHFGAALGVARLELLRVAAEAALEPHDLQPRPPLGSSTLHRAPGPRPQPSPRRSPGRSCRSHRPDAATARPLHSCCCTCSRSPRKPRRWAPGKACSHYRTWGRGRGVNPGRGTPFPDERSLGVQDRKGRESPGSRGESRPLSGGPGKPGTSEQACSPSPLLPALAHADAAPVAGSRVAATSLADLEADATGRAAQRPR